MTTPIRQVDWPELESWLRDYASTVEPVDEIVGISRAGAPIAVALSYLMPDAHLCFASRSVARGEKPPFYEFQVDRRVRLAALEHTMQLGPGALRPSSTVLIVDDVATTGDTLFVVGKLVGQRYPAASLHYLTFAADLARIGKINPQLLPDLDYAMSIDNARLWISFPWNLQRSLNATTQSRPSTPKT